MTSGAQAQTVVATPGQTVSTGSNGKQILFRDKTSITAGANSTITVKRAQYDANGTANVVIDVSKGAFRYITGDTAGSHTVKTPLSTVGVRGTVIEGFVDVSGYEVFALMEGAFEVCTTTGCQQVTTPGTFVVVYPNGRISPPAGIPTAMMNAMLFAGRPSISSISICSKRRTRAVIRLSASGISMRLRTASPPPPGASRWRNGRRGRKQRRGRNTARGRNHGGGGGTGGGGGGPTKTRSSGRSAGANLGQVSRTIVEISLVADRTRVRAGLGIVPCAKPRSPIADWLPSSCSRLVPSTMQILPPCSG